MRVLKQLHKEILFIFPIKYDSKNMKQFPSIHIKILFFFKKAFKVFIFI